MKEEYLKEFPNYEELNSRELFKDTDIQKFLHNPNGPAIIDHSFKPKLETYFINGEIQPIKVGETQPIRVEVKND